MAADVTALTEADPREALGRLVHETYQDFVDKQPRPWPVSRPAWDEVTEVTREAYMLIGEAVAAAQRDRIAAEVESLGHQMAAEAANAPGPEGAALRARADGIIRAAGIIRDGVR
jgi:hypothetical protein